MTFLSTPYSPHPCSLIFFLNDTATTEIYTLSLHDALPIWRRSRRAEIAPRIRREKFSGKTRRSRRAASIGRTPVGRRPKIGRHTSELQSHLNLVCRLLLEKKKNTDVRTTHCATVTTSDRIK